MIENKLNADLARAIVMRGVVDQQTRKPRLEMLASWGASAPIDAPPIMTMTVRGPQAIVPEGEIRAHADTMRAALMRQICADMRLDRLLAHVESLASLQSEPISPELLAESLARGVDRALRAVRSIIAGLEPDLPLPVEPATPKVAP